MSDVIKLKMSRRKSDAEEVKRLVSILGGISLPLKQRKGSLMCLIVGRILVANGRSGYRISRGPPVGTVGTRNVPANVSLDQRRCKFRTATPTTVIRIVKRVIRWRCGRHSALGYGVPTIVLNSLFGIMHSFADGYGTLKDPWKRISSDITRYRDNEYLYT